MVLLPGLLGSGQELGTLNRHNYWHWKNKYCRQEKKTDRKDTPNTLQLETRGVTQIIENRHRKNSHPSGKGYHLFKE